MEEALPGVLDLGTPSAVSLPAWGEPDKPDGYKRMHAAVRRLVDAHASQGVLLVTHGDAIAAVFESLRPGTMVYGVDFCAFIQVCCGVHDGDEWEITEYVGIQYTDSFS
eukprot:gene3738-4677_t